MNKSGQVNVTLDTQGFSPTKPFVALLTTAGNPFLVMNYTTDRKEFTEEHLYEELESKSKPYGHLVFYRTSPIGCEPALDQSVETYCNLQVRHLVLSELLNGRRFSVWVPAG